MKQRIAEYVVGISVICLAILSVAAPSCAAFTKQDAKYALAATQVICIIANETLGDRKIAEACNLADEVIPEISKVLSEAHRSGVRKAP